MLSQHVLQVAGVSKRFGGLQALKDVHLTIERGQVYGLIGPNGAGKTTFFNVITGLYPADSGSFVLADQPYQPKDVHLVAKAGIARTFQNIRLFAEMTALENVMVARHVRTNSDWLKGSIDLSKHGEVIVDAKGETSLPGVFAAGDCTTVPYKQIIIAMGEGAKASLGAFDYLIRSSVAEPLEAVAA